MRFCLNILTAIQEQMHTIFDSARRPCPVACDPTAAAADFYANDCSSPIFAPPACSGLLPVDPLAPRLRSACPTVLLEGSLDRKQTASIGFGAYPRFCAINPIHTGGNKTIFSNKLDFWRDAGSRLVPGLPFDGFGAERRDPYIEEQTKHCASIRT